MTRPSAEPIHPSTSPSGMPIPRRIADSWAALASRVEPSDAPAQFLGRVRTWLTQDLPLVSDRMQELILQRPSLRALLQHPPEDFPVSEPDAAAFRCALHRPVERSSPAALVARLDTLVERSIAATRGPCHGCGIGTLRVFHSPAEGQLLLVCDELDERFTPDLNPSPNKDLLPPATTDQVRRLCPPAWLEDGWPTRHSTAG